MVSALCDIICFCCFVVLLFQVRIVYCHCRSNYQEGRGWWSHSSIYCLIHVCTSPKPGTGFPSTYVVLLSLISGVLYSKILQNCPTSRFNPYQAILFYCIRGSLISWRLLYSTLARQHTFGYAGFIWYCQAPVIVCCVVN
jgi:hypothetical protein